MNLRPLLATVGGIIMLGMACGVGPDGGPESIDSADVPFSLLDPELSTTTTEQPTSATQSFDFYLIRQTDDGTTFVEPVTREVPLSPSATDIVSRLLTLETTEEEEADGLASRVPEAVSLQDSFFDQVEGVLTLDFSPELLDVTGDFQTSLFAQIVWTATGLEGVDQIEFRIDGQPIEVRVGDSSLTTKPVDRRDYSGFDPDSVSTPRATTTTRS